MASSDDIKNNTSPIDNVYEEVERLYKEKVDCFGVLEDILRDDFLIPKNVAADTIKHYLVATVNGGVNKYMLLPKKNRSSLTYISVAAYFLLMMVAGSRRKKENICDIVFENCFTRDLDENYNAIYEKLVAHKIVVLQTFQGRREHSMEGKQALELAAKKVKVDRVLANAKYSKYYAANISRKIFLSSCKNFFRYRSLSNIFGFDCLQLAIRIYKSMATFETDVNTIRSRVLVTFDDNGYGALRYYIYKKKLGAIIAIQNGCRFGYQSNRMGDIYLYSLLFWIWIK